MTEELTVTTERVDDLPLLLAQSERMGIADLLDSYFKPHGNWEGTSLGWTTVVWLTHLLSEGDPLVLDALAQPEQWQGFETALNQRLIRVYQLQPLRVRVDRTTTSGYWSVSEEGLFQLGYRKDHRPDLPQRKRDALGLGSAGAAAGDAGGGRQSRR